MTRSGMAAIFNAVLYSGFFVKREEFSSVEASSDGATVSCENPSRDY